MTVYYVAIDGSNGGDGSASDPWRSISHAMDQPLQTGDEVVVRPGIYTEQIYIYNGGSEAGQVTLRSEVPGAAIIEPPAGIYSTVNVRANYITIDGFDIRGGDGHGVDVESAHHTEVLNNIVHDSGGSGIQFNYSEFILIEGNDVYGNSGTNGYQTSGISVFQSRNISGDTTTPGFRTIIRNNTSHDNVETSAIGGDHTDGNGIIIDDNQSTQTDGFENYIFPTLIENNLVYGNGGKGIQVTWSDFVTVLNNTSWHNNVDPLNPGTWRGELSNAQSSNNTWVNNIAVADPGINGNNTAIDNTSYGGYQNENIVWENNLTFNGTLGDGSIRNDGGNLVPSAADGNLLGVDPRFVDPGFDFSLLADSPAVDAGSTDHGVAPEDLDGGPRQIGDLDLGALEHDDGTLPPPPDPQPQPDPDPQPQPDPDPQPQPDPNLEPGNIAPVANDDTGLAVQQDTPLVLTQDALIANDVDTDPLWVTGFRDAVGGTVFLDADGNVMFVPHAGFTGTGGFDYSVSDGMGGTDTAHVTIDIAAVTSADTGQTVETPLDQFEFVAVDSSIQIDNSDLGPCDVYWAPPLNPVVPPTDPLDQMALLEEPFVMTLDDLGF